MEVIIKNGTELSLTNIPDDEIELVKEANEEVITDYSLSDEDRDKIYSGCTLNEDMTITETEEYIENKTKEVKIQKKKDIEKIATLSDQLNMLANVLDTITSENPDQAVISDAKEKFKQIKDILNR